MASTAALRLPPAAPPKHQSTLILRHIREGFGTARLANPRFAGYQHQLSPSRQHAVKRRPKYIEFVRPSDDGSMPIAVRGCRIAHADQF